MAGLTLLGVAALSCIMFLGGCSPKWYQASADRQVSGLLTQYDKSVLGNRESSVQLPKALPAEPATLPSETRPAADETAAATQPQLLLSVGERREVRLMDLPSSLQLAFASSRDFKSQTESLYLQGLGFTLTQHNFGPILNSAISYIWNAREGGPNSDSLGLTAGASQILPTGGRLSVSGALNGARDSDPSLFDLRNGAFYNSTVQVNLRQPLLRGAGREVAYEPLTQGERNLIYAVRSFELFREDFAIRVANVYYQLQSQKLKLANDEQNYKDAIFDRQKAEALRQVDRYKEEDVFLARRREISAEDALLVSRTEYQLALDDFRILLGLPATIAIQIKDDEPEFQAVRLDPDSAVEAARINRLDLQTQRDQVEDTEREVRIARNQLLPDVGVLAGFGYEGDGAAISRAAPDRFNATLGMTVELPIDQLSERNSYRASLISLERSRRDLEQQLDEVQRDILNRLRELHQIEKRIELQTDQIARERRAVAITQVRYESGDAETRDVLDARQGLTSAQNALIDLKVQHFISRLRLLRDMGVFFVDKNGMWRP